MRARVGMGRRGARHVLVAGVLLAGAWSASGPAAFAEQPKPAAAASPIYGVTIPPGYRKWEMVAPAEEAAPLDELRVVLGNPVAIRALEQATLPFPDGTILVKLAYKRKQSDEFAPATVPGQATTVQVMVKDSRRYAATGGWGFGRFINGVPADLGQHQTCFACHQARVKNHDYVFTRLAP
ncbi:MULTISPECIES: cytochrome P460 family protein [Burkholderia]|uniref:Membrane protein n=1 Tax=Burkholderia cenocepacia (strain ATCC BAA-245 / DSM 16553 / LMG 16656 / NCTC 13227 / J2315 / CF5610) TaxID=216591 RepID=B4EKH9_BURCJ|nr:MULTISPECIES: cytochrome P460 family protein [Burkholderia]KIS50673.1 putative cytochrome P460 [Burkholderia cepacia]ALV58839.1 cytochrome C oxidase subunit III [Burkholderia cenocepacia]AOK37335.1 cytochrome C oxidase subunit III [Burkholderia cenocepacia]AQQ37892.1 cytochrome C oxidase subunit III [Burkholderia cenocepacia]AQQ45685.1 cytochrome C oxidase subunit III [Burkholderia cenocepacia]